MRSRIPQIATLLDDQLREAAEEALAPVVAAAKSRVPVDSGKLRDSIHVEVEGDRARIVAGNTEAWYGHLVEFGSAEGGKGRGPIPPHPFLMPAWEANRLAVEKAVQTSLKRLVEEGKRNL